MNGISVRVRPCGLRVATRGPFRVVAYADGGYGCFWQRDEGGWFLFRPGDGMPEWIERRLCRALGIDYIA